MLRRIRSTNQCCILKKKGDWFFKYANIYASETLRQFGNDLAAERLANSEPIDLHIGFDFSGEHYFSDYRIGLCTKKIANRESGQFEPIVTDYLCDNYDQPIAYEQAKQNNEQYYVAPGFHSAYQVEGEWWYFYEQPGNNIVSEDTILSEHGLDDLRAFLDIQKHSIERQITYDLNWADQTRPFHFGGNTVDHNGPLIQGVGLSSVPSTDIYGDGFPIGEGDIILSINGKPVFGERDLYLELNYHGKDRDRGIEEPINLGVQSEYGAFQVSTHYFFNPHHSAYEKDVSDLAIWYGFGDAMSFSQMPSIECYGSNILLGAANIVSRIFGLIKSKVQETTFRAGDWSPFEFIDAEECKWQSE